METAINWKQVPFVRLFIPLALGIGVAAWLPVLPGWLPVLGFVGLFPLARWRTYRWRLLFGLVLSVQLLLCGSWLMQQTNPAQQPGHLVHADARHWQVQVVRIHGVSARFRRVELRVQARLDSMGIWQHTQGRVLAYFPADATAPLEPGRKLLIRSRMDTIRGPSDPQAFDYRAYLAGKGIRRQCFLREGDWQEGSLSGGGMARIRRWQKTLLGTLELRLEASQAFPVAAAMVLGSRDALSAELRDAYTRTGALHVLAVSGLHVGLVYWMLLGLWKLVPWRHPWRDRLLMLSCLAGIWLFALTTGAAPSVLRASVLFSFLLIGNGLGRQGNVYNSLAASAFCMLWVDPRWLYDIGFQLSYTAVAGIVFFQPKIYKLLLLPRGPLDYVWSLTAVSAAAQLGTLPITLYYFHQFPMYFWLSGLLVVPAAPIILVCGLLLLVLEGLHPGWGAWPAWLLNQLIPLLNRGLEHIQHWPGSVWENIRIPGYWVFLLYVALVLVALGLERRRREL
jgi:competence protein ComEC